MLKALKISIAAAVSTGLLASGASAAAGSTGLIASGPSALERRESESCQAVNPGQPKCTFTVTSMSTSGTVTGAVGQGDWIVVIKRKKVKMTIGPSSTDPEPVSFQYMIGDKVTATVTSAGGWVVAGHD